MTKYKISDVATVTIFDKNNGEVIAKQKINTHDGKIDNFLNDYYEAKESINYEKNKDVISNYLIKKYFL
jgi:phosphoribosylcarboxyaminoimidazole (NCAIR) mutase